MQIRNAKIEDALNITYLKTQVWLHTYATKGISNEYSEYLKEDFTFNKTKETIENNNRFCFVAEQDGFLIAYCELDLMAIHPISKLNSAEMTILYVSEHFHGQGIGKALLTETENILKPLTYSSYWLSCYIENIKAVQFYTKKGFSSIGTTYFSMGDNQYENLIFQKEIIGK